MSKHASRNHTATRWLRRGALLLATAWLAACSMLQPSRPTVERMYVINCGEGTAGDVSMWSPGVNAGKSMPFVDNCYLIRHAQGWFLWDTGLADAVAAMPNGLAPANPRATHWYRPRTLAAQLTELGVEPSDIRGMAVSHTHPDHAGNVELFPRTMLYVQRAEYDWPQPSGEPRFLLTHPVTRLDGDFDVFGDGSLVILSTPGHTPGHQSLLVRLRKTGPVVLSGDLVHFADNWKFRRVPSMNVDAGRSVASMQRVSDLMEREGAQLWINHDRAQRDKLKMSPQFYD